jgi:hypothetical protein
MGFEDEVKRALDHRPGTQVVAGHNFPSIGARDEDRLAYLEHAVAAISNTLALIGQRIEQLEGRVALLGG